MFSSFLSSMLDDFAHEMDSTESKMENVMKKMAKVLHVSNGKWRGDVHVHVHWNVTLRAPK